LAIVHPYGKFTTSRGVLSKYTTSRTTMPCPGGCGAAETLLVGAADDATLEAIEAAALLACGLSDGTLLLITDDGAGLLGPSEDASAEANTLLAKKLDAPALLTLGEDGPALLTPGEDGAALLPAGEEGA
jgi:hypothetical protein